MKPLCGCGCGQPVRFTRSGKPNKYIHGHFLRGKPKSVEQRNKQSLAMRGRLGYWSGKTMSIEARLKMSIAKKGKPLKSEHRKKISASMTGKLHPAIHHCQSEETKRKKSVALKGNKSGNWKGGISKTNDVIRSSLEARLWKTAVMRCDHYTCQQCGAKHQKGIRPDLHVHHIKPFSEFPELRFEISNGITLCKKCHMKIHGLTKKV